MKMDFGWTPLLEVKAGGGSVWLGRDCGDRWVVGRREDLEPKKLTEAPFAAFPLLETPWPEAEVEILEASESAGTALPLDLVLRAALELGSYWPDRAVEWIEGGYPSAGLRDALASVVVDRRLSQNTRHRIRRLL